MLRAAPKRGDLAPEYVAEGSLLAKVASTSLAILANWLGNRLWTFGPHRRSATAREAVEFVAVSLLAMAVALACLGVSHDVLRLTSPLQDAIASNVVGLLLGSVVRFALYPPWVCRPGGDAGARPGPGRRGAVACAARTLAAAPPGNPRIGPSEG